MGKFDGKDISRYLEAYKAEMLMRDIPKAKQLSGFARVVTSSLHGEILEMIPQIHNWLEFERRLLEEYGLDDSL